MTLQGRTIADSFAAGSFAISAVLTALRTTTIRPELHTGRVFDTGGLSFALPDDPLGKAGLNLLGVVSQPSNPVLWILLAAVVVAVGAHMLSRIRQPVPPGREWAETVALMLAAVWPWLLNPMPLPGLALAALSAGLLTQGVMPQSGGTRREGGGDLPVAFIAGWLLVAATSALGMYVHFRLGVDLEQAVLIGLLVTALLGAWGQLRMNGAITFSLAIIWAMIGFAATTAGTSITIATACVLGISALAVVLVRVTT